MIHTAVLKKQVLEYLNPSQNENFIDCTIGEGGHAEEILKRNGPNGKVLGIDLDPLQISSAQWLQAHFQDRIILVNDSYANLKEIVNRKNFGPVYPVRGQGVSGASKITQTSNGVHGILLDLGMSSAQLRGGSEGRSRGFSFKVDQGLDMRYNDHFGYLTAEKILNEWPEQKIEKILKEYGEEKFSKKIAKAIVEKRKTGRIKTTFQLIGVIKESVPQAYQKAKIHYATRTFQALRIAVNDELENIKIVLPQALSVLSPGGKLAVISFHSLEDRIIKEFFADEAKKGVLKLINKKPVTASAGELRENPRARSAKLRAIIKIK